MTGQSEGHPNAPIDPVEAALSTGIAAIATSMATAAPGDLVQLAERMAALTAELRARREAKASNVIALDTRRKTR